VRADLDFAAGRAHRNRPDLKIVLLGKIDRAEPAKWPRGIIHRQSARFVGNRQAPNGTLALSRKTASVSNVHANLCDPCVVKDNGNSGPGMRRPQSGSRPDEAYYAMVERSEIAPRPRERISGTSYDADGRRRAKL
jgi:hypothetical protein